MHGGRPLLRSATGDRRPLPAARVRSILAPIRKRRAWPLALLLAAAAALSLPTAASALELEIVNESGRSPDDIYVTVVSPGAFDVAGAANDVPQKLSEIPAGKLTIDQLISGRVYISYGAAVQEGVPFDSLTRFDWAEMTVTPVAEDVANLTAVDQFAIGMRLDTLNGSGDRLESVGAANSNTIFAALQEIPGGPLATVRDADGNILRILSPLHSTAYPDLGDYVRSMAGEIIALRTAFFGTPFTTTHYSGTFAADGSIVLHGITDPPGGAPPQIAIGAPELIEDIYTGGNTPNNAEGAIRRDLLSAFSAGFWNGRYGNDALSFCTDPIVDAQGSYCPHGFNQPAFGDARLALSAFPTCEQYAAVINQHSDAYGNPYSDASKKVAVGLPQPADGGEVSTLRLTILPDTGDAQPTAGGNPNCGAAPPAPPPAASTAVPPTASPPARVRLFKLFRQARVKGARARIGRIVCTGRCGRVRLVARQGRRVLGRGRSSVKGRKAALLLRLTKPGKRLLVRRGRLRAKATVWVTPPGGSTVRRQWTVRLID